MEDFTITNLEQLLATIVSIIVSLGFLATKIRTWLKADMKELDKQVTMDFLIMEFARARRHELTEAEKIHLKQRYDHYTEEPDKGGLGGNSYIKEEYQELKDKEKI